MTREIMNFSENWTNNRIHVCPRYIKVGKPGRKKNELAKSEREQVKFKGKRIEWDMRDRN